MKPVTFFYLMIMFCGQIKAQQHNTAAQFAFKTGSIEVIALSDGSVDVDAVNLLGGTDSATVKSLLQKNKLGRSVATSINCYLVKLNKHLVLVDAGAGQLLGSQAGGKLLESLSLCGISADSITDILITHVHLDHSGGLARDGNMVFPRATVHVNEKELDFWQQHASPRNDEPRGITANRSAYQALLPYIKQNRVRTFRGDARLFPELKAIETSGHTAGHSLFLLESKSEKLIFWGDLIHVPAVQLSAPELSNEFDFDKIAASNQRIVNYKKAMETKIMIAADHSPFPGLGRLEPNDKTYKWAPYNR